MRAAVSIIAPMQWDLYCRVVDNFGDVGVAWRLAADLAGRGESVRLAIDDAQRAGLDGTRRRAGVEVVGWHDGPSPAPDVVVELFGAGRPPSRVAGAARRAPVFVNLEHLSAEPYVERSHGLPSPAARPGEPASTTWFFYPGFTEATGGLLREPGLLERRARLRSRATTGWRRSASPRAPASDASACSATQRRRSRAARRARRRADPAAARAGRRRRPGRREPRRLASPRRVARGAPAAARAGRLRSPALVVRAQLRPRRGFVRARDLGRRAVRLAALRPGRRRPRRQARRLPRRDSSPARRPPSPPRCARSSRAGTASAAARSQRRCPTRRLRAAWLAHCARWRDSLAAQADLVTRLLRFVAAKR